MPAGVRVWIGEPEHFSRRAIEMLERFAEVRLGDGSRESLVAGAAWADVVWVRLRHRVDDSVLGAGARLRAIVSPTTGLNHIDLAAAGRRGVEVLSLRGETAFLRDIRATAELTIGLMLALLRQIPGAASHVLQGGWERDRFRGNELAGMTVGLIGCGRLGSLVARYLHAFDARILASDPALEQPAVPEGVTLVSQDELLARASLVSLHANYCWENESMMGPAEFAAMQPGAWFVNTARGELVDEEALLAALESGRLRGAAVDVVRNEQSATGAGHLLVSYARRHDNLLITPHVGGCTTESMEKTEIFMAEKLEALVGAWRQTGSEIALAEAR